MRRLRLACIALVWMASALSGGQIKRGLQEDGADVVWAALGGRSLVVRVYHDPSADPQRFEKINIPMTDDTVRSSAIKAACPSITKSSLILFWAADQTDAIVGMALDRGLYTQRYAADQAPSIWSMLNLRRQFSPWWTFLDAKGKPIPGATVDLRLVAEGSQGEIPLGRMTLDDQGRLRRWLPWGATQFVMRVEHPDYGTARIQCYVSMGEPASGVYVVPLVRLDARGTALAAQGIVTDPEGNPVADAIVTCRLLQRPQSVPHSPPGRIAACAITNKDGWFALCMPEFTLAGEFEVPAQAGTRYQVSVEPPRESHLRSRSVHDLVNILAGTQATIVLDRMDTQEVFHTFAFEYAEGPVTSIDELRQIELVLRRDNREWARLRYDQWKDGCSLPTGTLQAVTKRWGGSFSFPETTLTAESLEHLVIRARPAVVYRGQVIDAVTKGPIRGALVVTNYPQYQMDPCGLTEIQYRQLREEAARQANDSTPQALYRHRERVTTADAEGTYEVLFMPGWSSGLTGFTILAPGYRRGSGPAEGPPPDADGAFTAPPVALYPLDHRRRMPAFLVEDETGPVTDPNRLRQITLTVTTPGGRRVQTNLQGYVERADLIPGVHRAGVTWGDRHYWFEPVDLTEVQPDTVVFRPARIERLGLTVEGQVVHAVTGSPVESVIVAYSPGSLHPDISALGEEDWAAIRAAGPNMDPGDPNLAALTDLLGHHMGTFGPSGTLRLTQTGRDGRYSLTIQQSDPGRRGQLLVLARNCMSVSRRLMTRSSPDGDGFGPPTVESPEPDDTGILRLNPFKLVPAGTVLIHPVVTDPGQDNRGLSPRLMLNWIMASGEGSSAWARVFHSLSADHPGASMSTMLYLQPNIVQSCYVPADVSLAVTLHLSDGKTPPLRLTDIRVAPGQVLDLGRVEMDPGVAVVVKVGDRQGHPVPRARIVCEYGGGYLIAKEPSDAAGIVRLNVPAHSGGRFRTMTYDRDTQGTEATVPYQVAGPEDAGKEFLLEVSDDIVRLLLKGRP